MESEREKIINDSRFERMEHHLKLLKDSNALMSADMNLIKTAIIGNEYTGGIGVIHSIKEMKDRIDKQDDDIKMLQENLTFSKNIIKVIVGVLSAYIVFLITK